MVKRYDGKLKPNHLMKILKKLSFSLQMTGCSSTSSVVIYQKKVDTFFSILDNRLTMAMQ